MFIFISHLNNVLALGIFHQVMKHHPMRVCDVVRSLQCPHSREIKAVIYTGVIRMVEGFPFPLHKTLLCVQIRDEIYSKNKQRTGPHTLLLPFITPDELSNHHTHKYVPLNSICLHTHKHRQVYYEIRDQTFLIKITVCILMKQDLSCQRFFAGEASSQGSHCPSAVLLLLPVHMGACDHHTIQRNQISTYDKVIVLCKFTCCFLIVLF